MISTLGSHTPNLTSLTPKPFLGNRGTGFARNAGLGSWFFYKNSSTIFSNPSPSLPVSNELQKSKKVDLHLRKMGRNSTPFFCFEKLYYQARSNGVRRGMNVDASPAQDSIHPFTRWMDGANSWMKINSPGTHP